MKWTDAIPWGFMLAALVFGIYQYVKRRRDKRLGKTAELEAEEDFNEKKQKHVEKTCEELYREALRRELGRIGIVGPGFENITTRIEDTFTSLRISSNRFDQQEQHGDMYLSPQEIMTRAFPKHRLLLVLGDPGSGKTTLLKYYAVLCLDKKHHDLGFKEKGILPLFFPLRELVFEGNTPVSLSRNLEAWAQKRQLEISAAVFKSWLLERPTLVLLDGLDEIGDTEKRRTVCQWVEQAWTGLGKARFVLTSRPTGYREADNIKVECPHLQGEIMDFTREQQVHFLDQWFHAVYLDELPVDAGAAERESRVNEARLRAQKIVEFLNNEENKSVRQLAQVPMMLQIMAIIWKDRDFLPGTRWELYDVSLNYLLEYRDKRRNLMPVLPADKARIVLAPAALRMLEKLRSDNAPKEEIHGFLQEILDTFDGQPEARLFCENLRDRAGVIGDYGPGNYIFRHRSFMEFLAAGQLNREVLKNPGRTAELAGYFPDPWWEETLRFFMGKADDDMFDRWMRRFFQSEVSRDLEANKQNLLQLLVKEAAQKKIEGLVICLNNEASNEKQRHYIIDCLKTIGTNGALDAIAAVDKSKWSKVNRSYAEDIVAGALTGGAAVTAGEKPVMELIDSSFRNPFEDNVEYIKIPGGSYKFSVTGKMETVPDLYFCKYLVTNKRYRKFISYLEGKEKDMEETLPLKSFTENLMEFAGTIKEYSDYLGTNPREWGKILRSYRDEDKSFNGDDQPVVNVTWYGARAYCLWLSCLQQQGRLYRLPTEMEWEWAAAGREPDNSLREYPWPNSKGEPTPELANYGNNVGATTPVGRYPEGATPEGLMDMAGNAWEWMDNWYVEDKEYRALRGGFWNYQSELLRCAARDLLDPRDYWYGLGFRVVCEFAPGEGK